MLRVNSNNRLYISQSRGLLNLFYSVLSFIPMCKTGAVASFIYSDVVACGVEVQNILTEN